MAMVGVDIWASTRRGVGGWVGGLHLQERLPECVFQLQGIPLLSLPGNILEGRVQLLEVQEHQ